jgi:hypothetical protein
MISKHLAWRKSECQASTIGRSCIARNPVGWLGLDVTLTRVVEDVAKTHARG